jgi:hypothetical protein
MPSPSVSGSGSRRRTAEELRGARHSDPMRRPSAGNRPPRSARFATAACAAGSSSPTEQWAALTNATDTRDAAYKGDRHFQSRHVDQATRGHPLDRPARRGRRCQVSPARTLRWELRPCGVTSEPAMKARLRSLRFRSRCCRRRRRPPAAPAGRRVGRQVDAQAACDLLGVKLVTTTIRRHNHRCSAQGTAAQPR